jgi:purine-binding chemotaxis protein CheW
LEVSLGQEKYAIPLLLVREVIAPPKTTAIPNSPAHFVGMMNLRGQVMGVIDLRKRLGVTVSKETQRKTEEAVVIVEVGGVSVGTVVDAVSRVLSIPQASLHEPPASAKKTAAHVTGIYEFNNELISVIALERVLDLPAAAAQAKAA